ncbi:hypothetical protein GN244_ATG19964 [Phytophthora infestans]|uniref:Uncharacterized protein n=1 Tax=Phytophthora infestans TaxID=4787 RepID=A0A833WIB6_PHYIN|nr:hypothetical protein GN244_ATG19964 [Phytophthora infestans]
MIGAAPKCEIFAITHKSSRAMAHVNFMEMVQLAGIVPDHSSFTILMTAAIVLLPLDASTRIGSG